MRLGVLSAVLPPYPCAESEFVFQLAEGLAVRGVKVTVITPHASAASPDFEIKKSGAFLGTLSTLLKGEWDAVVVPYQPWLFRASWWQKTLRTFRALRPNVPLHLLYMNPTSDSVHEWKKTFSLFTHILTLSERHRHSFTVRFPHLASRVQVVPCFSLAPEGPVSECRTRGPFTWVTLGYLYPGKGVELLLRAFARVHAGHPETKLKVVGGTMARDFSAWPSLRHWWQLQAEALGIVSAVEWVGEYSQRDFPTVLFESASAAVFPQVVGIGANNTAVATVSQFALPLVAFRGDFLDPQFEEEKNCVLAQQTSSPALFDVMARVQQDPQLLARLSGGAARLFKHHFSKPAAMEGWLAILRRSKPHSGVYLKDGNPSLAPDSQPGRWSSDALPSFRSGALAPQN